MAGRLIREARIVIPVEAVENVEILDEQMAGTFGGFTRTLCAGGWINDEGDYYREPGYVYDVATDDEELFLSAARMLFQESNQQALYVRKPDGEVRILKK